MSKPININEEVTFVPNELVSSHSSYSSISSSYPISNAYDSSSSTNYAYITCNTGSGASTYVSLKFPISGIPSGATIDSIVCKAKLRVSSTNYISTAVVQLYKGTTAMGSSVSARTTNATVYTISNPGTWTASDLDNLEIRYTGTRGTSNTTRAAYLYFYGADLTITYSISGTAYTITTASSINTVTVAPTTQDVISGQDAEVIIIEGITDLNDVTVEDNGTNVNNLLVQKEYSTGGTIERYPEAYTVSGSVSGTRYQSTIGHSVENPSTQTGNDYASSSTADINYSFDFSDIPANATITNMSVIVRGHLESTSNSSEQADLQLYSGNTAKGSKSEFTSTSSQNITMTPGTWTREELQNAVLRFTIGYYGGLVVGVTWEVTYTVPTSGNDYYYEYQLNDVSADHVITIEIAGAFIPPEEDPEKTYYPITISSINATTNPTLGTTRVEAGTNETITIYPSDPLVTLILDNGVDVSSQLTTISNSQPSYTVSTAPGASYGFNLNSSTGYYVSTNAGVGSSASVARVALSLPVRCMVTFTFINNGEETYDFGVFGKIDTTLSTSGWSSSSSSGDTTTDAGLEQLRCNTSTYNTTSTHTLNYEVESGEHYIDVKYGKDQGSDSGNDSLQFKLQITTLEPNNYYTYTLNNIQQKHNLIFVFGDVDYYYITSTGSNCKLYPDGQFVKLAGDDYTLTIVPDNLDATVTITDNNIDATNLLELKTSEIQKDGATITYKSYNYSISNIFAAHNIVVTCVTSGTVYMKVNGTWVSFSKIYKKIDDRWQEQTDFSNIFNSNTIYINN